MKNMLKLGMRELETVIEKDLDNWYKEKGSFFTCCVEGKMKKHARCKSTKPFWFLKCLAKSLSVISCLRN